MRALIVEDHAATAAALERVLERQGFAADVCGAAAGVPERIAATSYALILLDVRLPDGDGLELCRELRRRGLWVPVVMLSGRGGTTDVVRGLEAGADDYLVKPFAEEELRARVHALLRRQGDGGRGAPAADRLALGELELDLAAHRASWAGVPIELSSREFGLLAELVRHQGKVRSRADLLGEVWQLDASHRKLVDVYVGYLRRKLDRAGADVRIQTVRGVGYRLEAPDRARLR